MTTTETNLGRWEDWYRIVDEPEPFGETTTYEMGAEFLRPCALVEDWGCGKGYMRTLIEPERYRGIDGSRSKFADEVVDLADYRSDVPGIFMRHVMEHDYRWESILANAVASFRERMFLAVHTALADETHEINFTEETEPGRMGVPDLSLSLADITRHFAGLKWRHETLETITFYRTETVFFVERPG